MLRRRHRRQGRPADLGRRAADRSEGGLDRGRPLRAALQAGRPQGRLRPQRLLGLGAQLDHVALRRGPHARLRPGDRRALAAVRQRQRLRGHAGGYTLKDGDSVVWCYSKYGDPAPANQISVSCTVVGQDASGAQRTWAQPTTALVEEGTTAADLSEQAFKRPALAPKRGKARTAGISSR